MQFAGDKGWEALGLTKNMFVWEAIDVMIMLFWRGGGVGARATGEEGDGNTIRCGREDGHLRRGRGDDGRHGCGD